MLAAFARERGVLIGGINSNTFQDEDYKLGSLCHPSFEVRKQGRRAHPGVLRDRRDRPAPASSKSGSPTAPITPARMTFVRAAAG